jgi:glutamyl-tRNA reductase
VHEFVILNTCNRIELHAVVAGHEAARRLIEQVMGFDALAENEYYVHRGMDAFRHTAVLLAGLYSQVPGENHIVAQAKAAYAEADRAGWGGSMMREWLGFALHTSKDIRRATQPLLRHAEIEDLCLNYIESECREQLQRGVLVMGCGLIGRGIVRRMGRRFPDVDVEWCYHENVPTIFNESKRRVRLHALEALPTVLPDVHLVICATGSPTHLLEARHGELLDAAGTVTIVDLAMPRNVDPAIAHPDRGIHIADLDDLKHWYRREAADIEAILETAAAVVQEHRSLWQKLVKGFVETA